MPTGIKLKLLSVGHCVHPSFVVKPGSGIAPRKFPAAVGLIEHPQHGWILFDTGYHQAFFEATRGFPERFYAWVTPCSFHAHNSLGAQLQREDLSTGEIKHLLLSHLHADHIAGMKEFPHVRLYCHRAADDFMHSAGRIQRLRKGHLRALYPTQYSNDLQLIDDFPLDLGEIIDPQAHPIGLAARDLFGDETLYLVDLPGHAAGQMGLLLRLEQGFVFLLADACWLIDNLRDNCDPHWLSSVVSDDQRAYNDTLAKLRHCYRHFHNRVEFVPSHCEETLERLMAQGWLQ